MAIIDIAPYRKRGDRHQFYTETVDRYKQLQAHLDGVYPKWLIDDARPGESDRIKKYRKKIYQPITKAPANKVLSSLMKVRKSEDYVYKWSKEQTLEDESSLRYYVENEYPVFGSFDNYFWSVVFRQYAMDANGMLLIMPSTFEISETEFVSPVAMHFGAESVIHYEDGVQYVFKSKEVAYYNNGTQKQKGEVYYSCDTESIVKYVQSGVDSFTITEYTHGLGYCPVVPTYGYLVQDGVTQRLYESRLSAIVPRFNEAAREYSDLQAEVIQHVHSTFWAMAGRECKKCKGTGSIPKNGESISCADCGGRGIFAFNPYEHITVEKPEPGGQAVTPPAGYLSKPSDIAKLQNDRINEHIYYGLSAINYEFTATTPLNQSGTAKEIDRAELNNFVYSIAEDCIRIIDASIRIICDLRYSFSVPNYEAREEMLPSISVPVKYDIIPDSYLSAEIQRLKQSKVSPVIVSAAEVEYAAKKFYSDPSIGRNVAAITKIDTLSGVDENDLIVMLQNGGISQRAYVVHSNIREFVERAELENENFLDLELNAQRTIINGYADEFIRLNAPSGQVLNGLQ